MRCTLLVLAGLLGIGGATKAQVLPTQSAYAIVGARIAVGDGRVIENGTVLVRDGLIEAVGTNVTVPAGVQILKGSGLTVYPGFVDGLLNRGVTAPDPQPNQDTPPDYATIAPAFMREAYRKGIRPELRAGDYLTLTDDVLKPARAAGFTTALIVPTGGGINGVGALVNFSGQPRRDSIVRSTVLMSFGFGTGRVPGGGGGGGYPSSLMGVMALTRQTLLDAQHEQTLQTAFANGAGRRAPDDASLLALQPVLAGQMPAVWEADSENEIVRALRISDEFHLKPIVDGGLEAYKQTALLTQKQVPVLVSVNWGVEPVAKPTTIPAGPGTSVVLSPPSLRAQRRESGKGAGGLGRPGQTPAVPPSAAPAAPTEQAAPAVAPAQTPPANPPAAPNAPGKEQPQKEDAKRPTAPPTEANKDPKEPLDAAQKEADEETPPASVIAERHKKWEEKVGNALALDKAGVLWAFTSKGTRTPSEFLANVRQAIKMGLSKDAALKALTLNAAKIYGVDRQMGTVAPGKIAALIVMTGDFADAASHVRYVLIDRTFFDLDNDGTPPPAQRRPRFADEEDGHE